MAYNKSMVPEKNETIYLIHLKRGHRLVKAPKGEKYTPPGTCRDGGAITRAWLNFPRGLYEYLSKQKNLKLLCPECNPEAMKREAKWNGEGSLPTLLSR